jgi:hypothetical protein
MSPARRTPSQASRDAMEGELHIGLETTQAGFGNQRPLALHPFESAAAKNPETEVAARAWRRFPDAGFRVATDLPLPFPGMRLFSLAGIFGDEGFGMAAGRAAKGRVIIAFGPSLQLRQRHFGATFRAGGAVGRIAQRIKQQFVFAHLPTSALAPAVSTCSVAYCSRDRNKAAGGRPNEESKRPRPEQDMA